MQNSTQIILDEFQTQAMTFINEGFSVIVSAPTGSGKTKIAEHSIEKAIEERSGAIYTAPIKALSNQKFRDFQKIYKDKVGILTGDVSINSDAEILIMTTEIYRNSLFENTETNKISGKKWVIFDEIHYIDNIERGTVWEESIIFSPPEIRFLCLSATIPNIQQLASWIQSIRNEEIKIVTESKRPVPLSHMFQCRNKIYDNFKDFSKSFARFPKRSTRYPRNREISNNRTQDLLQHISRKNGFPCIYFSFGRKRCEMLAEKVDKLYLLEKDDQNKVISEYNYMIKKMNIEQDRVAKKLFRLIKRGIAFHHAGMLPSLKEIIERLFTQALIKLIFTTETFALGINMPAKSVVFDELRKFYGHSFDFLTTRDYYQMAGRSGRRGMDKIGNVYSRINPSRIPFQIVKKIVFSPPEKVSSQFNTTYAVLLSLYEKMGAELIQIYPKSFHYFQTDHKQRNKAIQNIKDKILFLKNMDYIDDKGLTAKGNFATKIYGYEIPLSELFVEGFFEKANIEEIASVLSAITFEPRKGYEFMPHLTDEIMSIRKETRKLTKRIFKKERRFKINSSSPKFHYHLSPSIIEWMHGTPFEELPSLSNVAEGELVRNFRMVIQMARELINTKGCSGKFYEKLSLLLKKIKRDVVDAEKQLSVN
ncbi:MAG: DEAD/DEAH box helicase [Candidatus Aureabacteria bacterium]|nr:DEAD/DEAH box helicase [Candidatus Auribacterota bacterium]